MLSRIVRATACGFVVEAEFVQGIGNGEVLASDVLLAQALSWAVVMVMDESDGHDSVECLAAKFVEKVEWRLKSEYGEGVDPVTGTGIHKFLSGAQSCVALKANKLGSVGVWRA